MSNSKSNASEQPQNGAISSASSPSQSGATASPSGDMLLVVSPAWLATFAPPASFRDGDTHAETDDRGRPGNLLAVNLCPDHAEGALAVSLLSHPELRLRATEMRRVVAMISDGAAVAAIANLPDTPVAVMEDAGAAAVVAGLANAAGLQPAEWPRAAVPRLEILAALLAAAGTHPESRARVARLSAYSLALNAGPTPPPVPAYWPDAEISARMAGIGRGEGDDLLTPDGLPANLSLIECLDLGVMRPAVLAIFREAARAITRYRTGRGLGPAGMRADDAPEV